MTHLTILQRSDYEDYLIRIYFRLDRDYLDGVIKRAYLDFNRTLRGMGQQRDKSELYEKQVERIKDRLNLICGQTNISQKSYDQWHQDTCQELIGGYQKYGFRLYVGQAQKWVNMSLKYIFLLGEERVPGFVDLYRLCHAPLDSIVLKALENYGLPRINEPWSKISNYNDYLDIQKWIRKRFDLPPLDIEFLLWQGKSIPMGKTSPIDTC